uniref:Rho GDP-dissociation inhibitor 1-like n=1 Tax=Ciona intestinalis TaxID=7719 RepID=H2Y196_CIOIN|nr:rho GDP-dissociation inhibitor 1-like [Ciona intestinalis]|eukprot:XP_002126587.1 rho GDP-dissociation inhibitor 1-like [Ciona intestinalis]
MAPGDVIVKGLDLVFEDGKTVSYDLTGDLSELYDNRAEVKRGITYKIVLRFQVVAELVQGLRLFCDFKRKGIRVDKIPSSIRSYVKGDHEYQSETYEMPRGFLAKGPYTMEFRFKNQEETFLEWEIPFDLE